MSGWLPLFSLSVGKAQVGLWFPYENGLDMPFMDHLLLASRLWRLDGTADPFANLNTSGFPTNIPAGSTFWSGTLSTYIPDPATNDKYVFTTDGTATISITAPGTCTLTRTLNAAGRQEFTLTSGTLAAFTAVDLSIAITAIPTDDTTYQKWFLKSNETALITNGKLLNPTFQNLYSRFGRVRFMDWMATNANPHVDWSNRIQMTQRSKSGANIINYCGVATLSGSDYTCPGTPPGNPSSYVDGQTIQFTTATNVLYKTITGLTNANPAKVSCASHGFSTGDKIIFPEGAFYPVAIDNFTSGKIFTITLDGTDPTNAFSLNGTDSTTWPAFAGAAGPVYCTKQIRAKAGSLPFAPLFAVTGGSMYKPFATDLFNNAVSGNQYLIQLIYSADLGGWTQTLVASGSRQGMPIELIVQTANELNVPPHICIPHMANDNYVTSIATYVRDHLNTSLRCSFELSNEVWNSAFAQTSYANNRARNNGWATSNGYDFWHGYRFYNVMGLIATVFSGQMSRVNRAMAVFTAGYSAGSQDNRFQAPGTGVAAYPATRMDAIHIAPYYEADRSKISDAQSIWGFNYGSPAQKQAGIVWLDNFMRDDGGTGYYTVKQLHDVVFPGWKTYANTPAPGVSAVNLEQYEGGGGQLGGQAIWNRDTGTQTNVYNPGTGNVTLTTTDRDNFFYGYLQSPEWAATVTQNWNNFVNPAIGGGLLPAQYVLVSPWSPGSEWGVIQGDIFTGVRTHAYDSLIAFNGR